MEKQINPHRTNAEIRVRNERGEKRCNTCREWQPVNNYHNHNARSSVDGLYPMCKSCDRFRKHNLTRMDVINMLADQGNRCAICAKPMFGFGDFDHDHNCCARKNSCGECVRGLLCKNCNFRVMALLDDIELVHRALAYAGRA